MRWPPCRTRPIGRAGATRACIPSGGVIVRVDRDRCIGCGACLVHAPRGLFVLDAHGKAVVTRPDQVWSPIDGGVIRHCPTYAISARPIAVSEAAGATG